MKNFTAAVCAVMLVCLCTTVLAQGRNPFQNAAQEQQKLQNLIQKQRQLEQDRQQERQRLLENNRAQLREQQRQLQADQSKQRMQEQQRQLQAGQKSQQAGKPAPKGVSQPLVTRTTDRMIFSNGVAKLTRPLTPAEAKRGFTGRVTADGRALVKFRGRVFAVPAARVGLGLPKTSTSRAALATAWTSEKQAAIQSDVQKLVSAPPGGGGGGGGENTGGPCDPKKSPTCNFNAQATRQSDVNVVKVSLPRTQARIDLALLVKNSSGRIDYSSRFESELTNFNSGSERISGRTDKEIVLVQYYDRNLKVGPDRSLMWWTSVDQANTLSSMRSVKGRLALPWGERNAVYVARIPAGTEVEYIRGTASSQESLDYRTYTVGGGEQLMFKNFDPRWITATDLLH